MIDEIAIQQILNLYSEGASRKDWDQAAATFLPNGIWEVPALGAKFEGVEAIRSGFITFTADMEYFLQMNAPAVIRVAGDKASARSVIREYGKFAGRNEVMEVLGFYNDTLIRTPEGWRFSHRIFELLGINNSTLQAPAAS